VAAACILLLSQWVYGAGSRDVMFKLERADPAMSWSLGIGRDDRHDDIAGAAAGRRSRRTAATSWLHGAACFLTPIQSRRRSSSLRSTPPAASTAIL
jgi:hypothetical protein